MAMGRGMLQVLVRRRPLVSILLTGLLLSFTVPYAYAETTYTGKVISIADGDTLRILYRDGQLKIRLAEIDTPERK